MHLLRLWRYHGFSHHRQAKSSSKAQLPPARVLPQAGSRQLIRVAISIVS